MSGFYIHIDKGPAVLDRKDAFEGRTNMQFTYPRFSLSFLLVTNCIKIRSGVETVLDDNQRFKKY